MSLFYLSTKDFHIRQGTNSPLLCTSMQHISLVMIHSGQSVGSQQMLYVFKTLPQMIRGCQFGIVLIERNMPLVQMSHQTNTPIEYVPLVIMYVNGIPYMEYKGPEDAEQLRQFIVHQYNAIEQQLSFTNSNNTDVYANVSNQKNVWYNPAHRRIPQYSLGNPIYGDDEKHYLSVNEGLARETGSRR